MSYSVKPVKHTTVTKNNAIVPQVWNGDCYGAFDTYGQEDGTYVMYITCCKVFLSSNTASISSKLNQAVFVNCLSVDYLNNLYERALSYAEANKVLYTICVFSSIYQYRPSDHLRSVEVLRSDIH